MAEFIFYGSDEDRMAILKLVFASREYSLLPNLSYPTPQPEVFTEANQTLLDRIAINRVMYVQGPYTLNPPSMRQLDGGKYDGEYVIEDLSSGPLLKLRLPGELVEDGLKLIPGSLFLPRQFYLPTGEPITRSEEIKDHHKKLVALLKKIVSRKNLEGTQWIGKNAWQKLEQGEAKILINGKWLGVPA